MSLIHGKYYLLSSPGWGWVEPFFLCFLERAPGFLFKLSKPFTNQNTGPGYSQKKLNSWMRYISMFDQKSQKDRPAIHFALIHLVCLKMVWDAFLAPHLGRKVPQKRKSQVNIREYTWHLTVKTPRLHTRAPAFSD